MEKDLEQNSEFRIKYPRGELGSIKWGFGAIYGALEDFRRSR